MQLHAVDERKMRDGESDAPRHYSNRTTQSVPSYGGSSRLYFLASAGGTKRPPRKWMPWKKRAHNFGALSDTRTSARSPFPSTLPSSTSQPLGTSTATIGSALAFRRGRSVSKGARMSPRKPKPKMA